MNIQPPTDHTQAAPVAARPRYRSWLLIALGVYLVWRFGPWFLMVRGGPVFTVLFIILFMRHKARLRGKRP